MSYNNRIRLKVNVNKFVTQIWQSKHLVSFDVALAALRNPTLRGRHGVLADFRYCQYRKFAGLMIHGQIGPPYLITVGISIISSAIIYTNSDTDKSV